MLHKNPSVAAVLLIAGLGVWLFADALFGSGVFVFRDAGHYYYPLFEFVRRQWLAGQAPLWNPYENLGVPLAANPTASVFYPGAIVLLAPLSFAWAYKLYVLAHLALAAWGAFRLARHWQTSVEAATIAAMSYAFCGNVLFQYSNVVFLVGAAWLPWAVLAADRMLAERPVTSALRFGAILALITLGGDPQMAYHIGLITFGYYCCSAGHRRRDASGAQRSGIQGFVLLAMAGIAGLALAAVQVFPTVGFLQASGRAASPLPRTVYEIPGRLSSVGVPAGGNQRWSDGLTCRRFEPGSHLEDVYQFSVGPWRLAEYVWPNAGGRPFPVHQRWFDAIPAEGRTWTPSLYMGLLPLVLALGSLRLWRTDARTGWLSWIAVLSVVASFGWYGPGWMWNELRCLSQGHAVEPDVVGCPFGGLYWLMTLVLPGYIYFRYPAKLLVLAALGLSMLAAIGWDRSMHDSFTKARRWLLAFGGLSVLALVGFWLAQPWWREWLWKARPNAVFGPMDASGATWDVSWALVQTSLLAVAFWWLLPRAGRGNRWAQLAALVLVAIDLGLSNRWMVACAPSECWQSPSKLAAALAEQETEHGDGQPYRVYRDLAIIPEAWQHRSSPSRLIDLARWQRDTLFPKHNLLDRIAMAEVPGTMLPHDYETFIETLKQDRRLHAIGVRYEILSASSGPTAVEQCPFSEDAVLWRHSANPSLVEIRHDGLATMPGDLAESCRVVRYEPCRVELIATLTRPGLVVLRDQYDPGWRLTVETAGKNPRDASIVRVERVMRGVWLPAGEHRLVYRYQPASVLLGALISGISWLALAVAAIRQRVRSAAAG